MRAALLARVSSEEQVEGYSIDAQRRAFRQFCEARQWVPKREYIEEGKSAHTDDLRKRPVFKQAIDDAIAGQYDVLVVHKIDRFSRRLKVTLEYFEKLGKAGVGFVSIQNDIDYSTPTGKFMLVMQGGLAELYSDNLSEETKKGWHERRKQGLYCGTLPFGAMKGEDGVPLPDITERNSGINGHEDTICNYEGLKMAFELSARGKSDREIAIILNTAGYRTTGTHGPRHFAKDTIKDMLKNRFYIGYIPDGDGGWLKAKHGTFVNEELFEAVQRARASRARQTKTVRSDANIYSLTGIARCAECGSTMRTMRGRGRVRTVCNGRIRSGGCNQPSTFLDVYEQQLLLYLRAFRIPENYQKKIIKAQSKLEASYNVENERKVLQGRLNRVKELYEWGHKSREEYKTDYAAIYHKLQELTSADARPQALERLASFLKDIASAWEQADREQRNKLAGCLFEVVWIKDKNITAVTPRPEFKPFFDLRYEGLSHFVLQMRPRGDSNPRSPP
jgi:site-specific DNA recombinase